MLIKRYKHNISISKLKIKNGGDNMNSKIQELQKRLALNMNKAVILANQNTIRNQQGHVVMTKDDEWRDEDDWDR